MLKNLFYFTKREKSGIIFLIVLIAGIFIGKFFFSKQQNELNSVPEQLQKDAFTAEPTFSDSTRTYYSDKKSRSGNYSSKYYASNGKRTYFDNSPGKTSDFKNSADKHPAVEKYSSGTKIDINSIDTAGLMKVPGIGQSYAARILKYRHLLGGYYSVEQLKEVYGMYEELYDRIVPFFDISRDSIVLISINKASLERLKSHPYINFYQAKAIVEMRKKKGHIRSLGELSLLEEFTAEDLEKMKNYLSFD